MKWVLATLLKIKNKATSTLSKLWKLGIGDIIKNRRYVKAFIDIIIVAIWCYLVIFNYHNQMMVVAGVALIMAILSRIFTIDGNYVFSDLIQPFITIAVYAVCAFLYWYVLEFALLAGILLLPCMTNEMIQEYENYYWELSP